MNYCALKEKQKIARPQFPDILSLRVHRALSWLNKSEQCDDDLDSQFIFLWIAFNAAYAQDIGSDKLSETTTFQQFIRKLCKLDKEKAIYELLWAEFPSSIRLLIDNKYVFQPFWNSQNGKAAPDAWEKSFANAKNKANKALANSNSPAVLTVVLSRLYTLRNQMIHGGATWASSANREQVRDAVSFLSKLVPIIIHIMIENPNTLWGEAHYPLVD